VSARLTPAQTKLFRPLGSFIKDLYKELLLFARKKISDFENGFFFSDNSTFGKQFSHVFG
jgi:hypothetical protein